MDMEVVNKQARFGHLYIHVALMIRLFTSIVVWVQEISLTLAFQSSARILLF